MAGEYPGRVLHDTVENWDTGLDGLPPAWWGPREGAHLLLLRRGMPDPRLASGPRYRARKREVPFRPGAGLSPIFGAQVTNFRVVCGLLVT